MLNKAKFSKKIKLSKQTRKNIKYTRRWLNKPVYFNFLKKKRKAWNYQMYKKFKWWRSVKPYYFKKYHAAPWIYYTIFSRALYIQQRKRMFNRNFKPHLYKSNKVFWKFLKIWKGTRYFNRFHLSKIVFRHIYFYFFGKINKNRYKKIFRTASRIKSNTTDRRNIFLKKFETRADILVYRANWGINIRWARNLVTNKVINIQSVQKYKIKNGF